MEVVMAALSALEAAVVLVWALTLLLPSSQHLLPVAATVAAAVAVAVVVAVASSAAVLHLPALCTSRLLECKQRVFVLL
jgi:hypothetical protein